MDDVVDVVVVVIVVVCVVFSVFVVLVAVVVVVMVVCDVCGVHNLRVVGGYGNVILTEDGVVMVVVVGVDFDGVNASIMCLHL